MASWRPVAHTTPRCFRCTCAGAGDDGYDSNTACALMKVEVVCGAEGVAAWSEVAGLVFQ